MRFLLLAATLALLPLSAAANPGSEPPPPELSAAVSHLEWGIFCAGQAMDRAPAPGTETGWIHVPRDEITFHWPDEQTVPAVIGLAFGVKATGKPGWATAAAEVRVHRPGRTAPETWASDISDVGPTLAFFRFDRADELTPGRWAIEGWNGDTRLYRVEFLVVPAETRPGIAASCNATS